MSMLVKHVHGCKSKQQIKKIKLVGYECLKISINTTFTIFSRKFSKIINWARYWKMVSKTKRFL